MFVVGEADLGEIFFLKNMGKGKIREWPEAMLEAVSTEKRKRPAFVLVPPWGHSVRDSF